MIPDTKTKTAAMKFDTTVIVALTVTLVLIILAGQPLAGLPAMVDWKTVFILSGLLIVTTGIRESGFFYFLAGRISRRIANQRYLALFLVFLSAALSMFLTNDIALFIMVPLALDLESLVKEDYGRIIILEALAVNAGSALTPIGNPQNIFLWRRWGISFTAFVRQMAPLVMLMSGVLLAMVFICVPSKKVEVSDSRAPAVNRGLFMISSGMLLAYVVSLELGYEDFCLPLILMAMLIACKKVVFKSDWGLILFFISIFVDIELICRLEPVKHLLAGLDFSNPLTLMLSGTLFSQIISNFPAAVLLARHSSDFRLIAYGVNLGANGLVIGSLANLIALRLSRRSSSYLSFHALSIPYLALTLAAVCYLL